MISDTSSALNEFLLTYKPVVTFKNRRPGPQLIDIDDPGCCCRDRARAGAAAGLMGAIRDYADAIHPVSRRPLQRTRARCRRRFIAAGARNPRPKPRNWWRKLKISRRIGYWGRA